MADTAPIIGALSNLAFSSPQVDPDGNPLPRPTANMETAAAKFMGRVPVELQPLASEVIQKLYGSPAAQEFLQSARQSDIMGLIAETVDSRLSRSEAPDQAQASDTPEAIERARFERINSGAPDQADAPYTPEAIANSYLNASASGELDTRYGGDENTPELDTRNEFLTEVASEYGSEVADSAGALIASANAPSALSQGDVISDEALASGVAALDEEADTRAGEGQRGDGGAAAALLEAAAQAQATADPAVVDPADVDPAGGDTSAAMPVSPEERPSATDTGGGAAAAAVAQVFDKPMTKDDATKSMAQYKEEFLEAMPEYQGVSEEEKGYRFIEAGLRVMAGQSPNAIENIATGLKGLGAEFAKDEKEKRAYDRQVDLSAAKYGLESIAKDEALAQSLAKEKRSLYNKIFVVQPNETFEWQGKIYSGGDRIIASTGSLQDGTFPIGQVTTEAFSLEQIKKDAVALKAKTDALFKRVEPPSKFVSSQIKYIEASTQIKANVAISNLLKEAVVPLQAGKVTGGLNALKTFAQRIKNFTGLDIPYADETPDAYRDKVSRAITANITSLLNEGNRTVSDADRTRAEQIGGLYADNLLAPSTKSAELLTEKLRAFEESIQRNNSKNIGVMSGVENAWNGTLNNALVDYGDILRKSRGSLGSTAERATPGSKRTVKWTDIISVNPDNPSVLNYKSDWFTK